MVTGEEIRQLIENGIPGAKAEVRDLTGTSDHFDVRVTASEFKGLSLLEQHKMVHAAVDEHIGNAIHALQIKTIAE